MSLLERSICGAILILLVFGLRALLLEKLPKRTFLVLWGLAIFRLLAPFVPFFRFSVFGMLMKAFDSGQNVVGNVENPEKEPLLHLFGERWYAQLPGQVQDSGEWIFRLWLVGMVVCAAYFLISYGRCLREFKTSLPVEEEWVRDWLRWHRTKRKLSVRQSDRIRTPLTYGVIEPVILLPKSLLKEERESLKSVLEHEFVHVRSFDALIKLILVVALCMHWFNPLVWVMLVYCNRDMELACDERVLKELGEDARAAYARTLIGMEAERSGCGLAFVGSSKKTVEARVRYIMRYQKSSGVARGAGIGLILVVALFFSTTGNQDNSLWWRMKNADREATDKYGEFLGENHRAHILVNEFWEAYLARDEEKMRDMLPKDYDGLLEGFPVGDARFDAEKAHATGSQVQTRGMKVGDICRGRVHFFPGVEGAQDWDLWLEVTKTENGFELVAFLGIEEREVTR